MIEDTQYQELIAQARAQILMAQAQRDAAMAQCIELAGQVGVLQQRLNAPPDRDAQRNAAMQDKNMQPYEQHEADPSEAGVIQ